MKFKKSIPGLLLCSALLLGAAGCGGQPAAKPETQAPSVSQPAPAPSPTVPAASDPASADPTAAKADVSAAYMVSDTEGWVGGKGVIFHTTDGGKSWGKSYSGTETIGGFAFLHGNPKAGWAFQGQSSGMSGAVGSGGGKQALLQTVDGGATWTVVSTAAPLGKELHFVSELQGFSGNQATADGGKTWTELPVPPDTAGEAYFTSSVQGWAVTNQGSDYQIERTADGGKSWMPVYKHAVGSIVNGAVIRATSADDIWVQLIGDSGMTQTSYTLLHSLDGGKNWTTVAAKSTAGGGPAPGFAPGAETGPAGPGNKPGPLLALSPQIAFMTGLCASCGDSGTIAVGWTLDAGKTWTNGSQQLSGQDASLSFADDSKGWLLTRTYSQLSVLYATADGGKQWNKVYTFAP